MALDKLNNVQDTNIGKVINISSSNIGKIGSNIFSAGVPYNRFYFDSANAPSISPTFGTWSTTTGATRRKLTTSHTGTGNLEKSLTKSGTNSSGLWIQSVSDALIAQTVPAGYLQGQMCWFRNGGTAYLRFHLRVCNSGGTITQNILTSITSSTNFSTSWINRKFMNATDDTVNYSSFSVNAGDRLIIEVGVYGSSSSDAVGLRYGDNQTNDLPQDETTTAYSTRNPWIQFSDNIYLGS